MRGDAWRIRYHHMGMRVLNDALAFCRRCREVEAADAPADIDDLLDGKCRCGRVEPLVDTARKLMEPMEGSGGV
jgi:hypothetical protein